MIYLKLGASIIADSWGLFYLVMIWLYCILEEPSELLEPPSPEKYLFFMHFNNNNNNINRWHL